MQILFTAFEAEPFMKTGGLADVAGSLPAAVKAVSSAWQAEAVTSGSVEVTTAVKAGSSVGTALAEKTVSPGSGEMIDIRVMLPKYSGIPTEYVEKMRPLTHFHIDLAWRKEYCGIFVLEHKGVTYYFLDNERYFFRDSLYGYNDDCERMAFFSKACLEACLYIKDFEPDIIHCNDWHTALTPVYLREQYMETHLAKAKTVFTIHNLKFQGVYDPYVIADTLGLQNTAADAQLRLWKDFGCCANFMLGACTYADMITTVSPTYAQEICTPYFGEGLDWLFSKRQDSLRGILNGIDYDVWNPATDPFLSEPGKDAVFSRYSIRSLKRKTANKLALQRELGLREDKDIPLFAVISRLTEQKGLDLVTYILPHIAESEMQLVVLGTGEYRYEEAFSWYAAQCPDKISAQIKFDNALSHRIYASADVMMIPSRFEPCGLTQLISMHYGTLPLVRETGGLKDTVDSEKGFSFVTFNADDMKYSVDCALDIWYNNRAEWMRKQKNAMRADFSWTASANAYAQLYAQLL